MPIVTFSCRGQDEQPTAHAGERRGRAARTSRAVPHGTRAIAPITALGRGETVDAARYYFAELL